MMRIGLILILALALTNTTSAYRERGPVGPYNVSFDMNTSDPYRIIVDPPSSGRTSAGVDYTMYNLTVDSGDYYAFIILTRYNASMLTSIDANRAIVSDLLRDTSCDDSSIYQPLIDGHAGMLGYCSYPSGDIITCASYSPDSTGEGKEPRGRTNCRIVSTYPWEVTRDMLNTLHVEAPGSVGGNTSFSQPSGSAPPGTEIKAPASEQPSVLKPVKLGRYS